jgi:DNA-binding MarR family transcriptional regulator
MWMDNVENRKVADDEMVVTTCTSVNLRRAARAASHILYQHLQSTGLRPGQFGILVNISKVGSTTITQLAEILVNDRTTITRNIALMERDGLVAVRPGKDRRVREVTLTEAGKHKLAEAYPLWREAEASIRERLGADRWEQTLANARAMADLVDSFDE